MTAADPAAKKSVVLVVEDDEAILDFLSFTLEQEGYQVFTANDGQAGLDIIMREKPLLVLLDLMLPSLDGFEILQRMKQDEETARIPVVVVSAYADSPDTREQLEKAGNVRKVFTKPVRSQDLLNQVKSLIG